MLNWCLANIRYTVLCLNIFSKMWKGVLTTTTKRWIFFFSQSQLLIQWEMFERVLFNITVRVPREIRKLQWIPL
uniref:Uncharacterized protein Nbla04021 n=1 Tax=Homo sapiens TaxID=9606 RepID=Q3LID4_HUMAN|nr:putative protein product of Nbla04021 [Homo sapiens]